MRKRRAAFELYLNRSAPLLLAALFGVECLRVVVVDVVRSALLTIIYVNSLGFVWKNIT